MPKSLSSASLARLAPAELDKALSDFLAAAPTPAQSAIEVAERIADFERTYHCSSPDLLAALQAGRMQEDDRIAEWLFWLQVQQDLGEPPRA